MLKILLGLAWGLLAGCSPGQQPVAPPQPPPKTVFDPLTQSVERAREVQKTVDSQAEKTRGDVESAERGDSPP